ncbi:MAG: glycosyltransferase family 39 protein [Steroidobacteraceae bacterium]
MPTRIIPAVDGMLAGFASVFEISPQAGKPRRWEKYAVLAILLAAAWARFWGLDGWGLEGDEDTMALPAAHILRHGTSYLPSGMFYARGIAQLYMMAASMMAFGETEWAMRFPSVICGLLVVVLAYLYGRRFLAPVWNIAFVAAVAFLPASIADSQEARMYIFLLACLTAYTILVFEWERTDRIGMLIAAVAVMIIGIQFHTLAVFGAFIVFYPGILHADRRKLIAGAVAFAVIVLGYALISRWVASFYPPHPQMFGLDKIVSERKWGFGILRVPVPMLVGAMAGAAAIAVHIVRPVSTRWTAALAGALLFAGLGCQIILYYHLACMLLVAGAILAHRHGKNIVRRLSLLVVACAILAVAQLAALHAAGIVSPRKIIGLMTGLPSVWPFLNLAAYSPGASIIVVIGIIGSLWRLFMARKISDIWLFFMLSVWLPLLGLGLFTWYPEPRYTEFALLPLLLCGFACLPDARSLLPSKITGVSMRWSAVAACLLCVLFVNPLGVKKVVNAGYTIHPDHKGAAEFMKSLRLAPNDIVVAEDVIEQTYYLKHVDYWLIGSEAAADFVEDWQGRIVDIYTHTPVIDTGERLQSLIKKPERGAIYVIGSGEDQGDDRLFMRGSSISKVLRSEAFKRIYLGRDKLTEILKVDAPPTTQTPNSGA